MTGNDKLPIGWCIYLIIGLSIVCWMIIATIAGVIR
jgi:hypothetical protein